MKKVILSAFVFAALSTSAFAADMMDWSMCQADIAKVCAGVTGDENVHKCLTEHAADVSKECQASMSHAGTEE